MHPAQVADLLIAARADDVAIIDVRERCDVAQYFVLATARSPALAYSAAHAIVHELRRRTPEVIPGLVPTAEVGAMH